MTHSEALAKAAEAARLFPRADMLIGPAAGHWFALTLVKLGLSEQARLLCYFAVRRVLFPASHGHGNLTAWLERATCAEIAAALENAACEVV